MSQSPARVAATTASGPKPLVTATTLTVSGSPPARAMRPRTSAKRAATSAGPEVGAEAGVEARAEPEPEAEVEAEGRDAGAGPVVESPSIGTHTGLIGATPLWPGVW